MTDVKSTATDDSFHSCNEDQALEAPDETIVDGVVAESPEAGMTRDKLIEMGFSEEEADWAVQQAKDQKTEDVNEDDIQPKEQVPANTVVNAAVVSPAGGGACIRRAGCKCADCADMAGLTLEDPSPKVPPPTTVSTPYAILATFH